MDSVVAALGERLGQARQTGDAEAHARVEGNLELSSGRQSTVDAGVGSDDLDLEARHAQLSDLLDRCGDAMGGADPIGDQGYPRPLA